MSDKYITLYLKECSDRSRISFRGGVDLLRGGGVDLGRRRFLVKMCAKMKELRPVEGRVPGTPLRSANGIIQVKLYGKLHRNKKPQHPKGQEPHTSLLKLQHSLTSSVMGFQLIVRV